MKMETCLKLLCLFVLVQVSQAGYPDFLCPRNPPAPGQNSSAFFSCREDCMHQHGAVGGTCGDASKGNFNCYCEQLTGERYEASLHCMKKEDRYRELCTADCLCSHGASGGYCDWGLKACVCMGSNPNNVHCPAKNPQEFARIIYEKTGKEDLGPYGLGFVSKIIPID